MNRIQKARWQDRIFYVLGWLATSIGLLALTVFIFGILQEGLPRIDAAFFTSLPSRVARNAGIYTALMGTLWVLMLTGFIAIPIGIASGIYLEEYGRQNWFARFIEINITNLAGVPSIIYGLLGLQLFSRVMGMGGSLLAGTLTLGLLVMPIIIVATRESVKAVPVSLREASFALGATKWQTILRVVLPASLSGILTGVILALSRAIGEAAPLIVVGALAYVPFAPTGLDSEFTVLPIQIFNWVSRPQKEFLINASAGIIVMLCITFLFNSIAVFLRIRQQRKVRW